MSIHRVVELLREGGRVEPLQQGDPGQVAGYRLLGRLGEGGMAQVFLGASPGGRKVAVKVIRPEYARDPEFRRRFAREIEAARQVGGFHTALVIGADPDAEPPWMVTAYIPGPSLEAAVAKDGPLSPAGVRELGAALAEGLTAIHACGLVHRDLKPGNVILAADGPRIIDFGIARSVNASALTTVHALLGTYGYMSPEQLGRQEVTARSDVFALGGLLVFAATGHGPFDADDLPAVIGRILSQPPDLSPLTGPLRDVLASCLDREPDQRPSLEALLAYFSAVNPGPWNPASTADTVTGGGSLPAAAPPLDARAGQVALVTFSSDGRLLASAAEDGTIRLWDTGTWRQATPALASGLPGAQIEQLTFTPDAAVVLATAPDVPAVLAWEVRSGQPLAPVSHYACLAPDGLFIATEGKGAPLLWEWDSDQRRYAEFPLEKTSNRPIGLLTVFSPDHGLLAATDDEQNLHLWDTDLGKHLGQLYRPHRSYTVTGAAISADSCFVAVQGETRRGHNQSTQLLELWDIADFHLPQRHLLAEVGTADDPDWDMEFSADSRLLASTAGGRLHVWDTVSRERIDLGGAGDDGILLFSPDSRLLLDAGRFQLRLWDTSAPDVSAAPKISADHESISCVAFSPDGRLIATAEGTAARVWRAPGR